MIEALLLTWTEILSFYTYDNQQSYVYVDIDCKVDLTYIATPPFLRCMGSISSEDGVAANFNDSVWMRNLEVGIVSVM